VPVGGVQRQLARADRAAQHAGVHHVGQQVVVPHQLTAAAGLGLTLRGQVDVDPAGEEVLGVPFALAVPQQYQGPNHGSILPQAGDPRVASLSGDHHVEMGLPRPAALTKL
jgi:hypothetical protein